MSFSSQATLFTFYHYQVASFIFSDSKTDVISSKSCKINVSNVKVRNYVNEGNFIGHKLAFISFGLFLKVFLQYIQKIHNNIFENFILLEVSLSNEVVRKVQGGGSRSQSWCPGTVCGR